MHFSIQRLVNWDLESRELISPALIRSLVKDTVESRVVLPQRTRWELAKHLGLTLIVTSSNSGVKTRRLNSVLNPVNHDLHVVLGVRTRLEVVSATVSGTGNKVKLVPVLQLGEALRARHAWVHDITDRLPVVDGGSGGNRGIGLSVVVNKLAAGLLESSEIWQGGLEGVHVADHSGVHPFDEGVVGDVVEGGKVIEIDELDELGDELTAGGGDIQFPGLGVVVPLCLRISELGADLEREVGAFALAIVETVDDGLGNSDVLGRDGTALSGLVASGATFGALAEAKAERCSGLGGTVVFFADDGGHVEVQKTEVSAGDDAVGTAVERVTCLDGLVDDLGHGAGARVVVEGLLDDVGEHMVDLLLAVAEGWGAGDGAVVLVSVALDLAHSLTTTIGATLVVGVELGAGRLAVEALGEVLAELGHLTERLVTEHVSGVPVDRAVAVKYDFIVRSTVQGIVTSGGSTSDSTVLKTTGGTGRQRVATTSSDVKTLLVFGRLGESVLDDNSVALAGVSVGHSDVAVAVGVASSGVGGSQRGEHINTQDGTVGRQSSLHIGNGTHITKGGGTSSRGESHSRGACLKTHDESSGMSASDFQKSELEKRDHEEQIRPAL